MPNSNENFKKAVEWFKNLSSTDKARLIEDPHSFEKEEQDLFFTIVAKVQEWLSKMSKEEVIRKLRDLNFGTFGDALVEKIIEKAPPVEYSARIVNELDPQKFRTLLEIYITDSFLGGQDYAYPCDKLGLDPEICRHLSNIFRSYIFHFLAGLYNLEQLQFEFKRIGLNDDLASIFTELLTHYETKLHRCTSYAMIWQLLDIIRLLSRRIEDIDEKLDELISLLKDYFESLKSWKVPPEGMFR